MLSVAYITNIPSPYRTHMMEAWARGNPGLALSVFYTHPTDQGRGWTTAPAQGITESRLTVLARVPGYGNINAGLGKVLRSHDVVMIGGFEEASYLLIALMSRLARKPVIMLFDGFSPRRFGFEKLPVRLLKRFTAFLCDVFFANGEVGRRYLVEQLRVPASKPIFNQFLSHLDRHIAAVRNRLPAPTKRDLQIEIGLTTDRKVLLCCGYLIPRKRIDLVIAAISLLPEAARPVLLVVGTGPERDALARAALDRQVRMHFAGFKEGLALATCYFAADALVLASDDDPWGLVVNEAMSAGLPVIVSDACGASLDLVRAGQNGYTFRSLDVPDLARAIDRLLSANLAEMGERSKAIVGDWTADRSAENLGRCIRELFPVISSMRPSLDVIVLHERDGAKYMAALARLSADRAIRTLRFASASVFRKFCWDVLQQRRGLRRSAVELLRNLRFRFTHWRLSDKLIIMGVAPWDYRLLLYKHLSSRNRFIYHTSWPYWDVSDVPRRYGSVLNRWLRIRWLQTLAQSNVEVVTVTDESARGLRKVLPDKSPITVIPHLVEDVFFQHRASYATPFRVLYVGELSQGKGVDLFPDLLRLLGKMSCTLEIVGDGPKREFIQSLMKSTPNVTWHGRINDRAALAKLMSRCQVLIAPSRRTRSWEELFGMSIAESMAMGLPVIASRHVGPAQLIEDGVSGYLVDENVAQAFEENVAALMKDSARWANMSRASIERAQRYKGVAVVAAWRTLLLGRER